MTRDETPRDPLRDRVFLCPEWLGDRYCAVPTHPIDGKHSDHVALASSTQDAHPDDGHEHSFGCRLCGVDRASE